MYVNVQYKVSIQWSKHETLYVSVNCKFKEVDVMLYIIPCDPIQKAWPLSSKLLKFIWSHFMCPPTLRTIYKLHLL